MENTLTLTELFGILFMELLFIGLVGIYLAKQERKRKRDKNYPPNT